MSEHETRVWSGVMAMADLQDIAYIRQHAGDIFVGIALIEEAGEVSKAASKWIRAQHHEGATPVSTDEAMDDMKYEYWDFETAAVVMGLRLMPDDPEDVRKIRKRLRRWRDRLMKERK